MKPQIEQLSEFGMSLRVFFSHAIVIKLSKHADVMDDLTANLIKSTSLWLRSHGADVTGKVKSTSECMTS